MAVARHQACEEGGEAAWAGGGVPKWSQGQGPRLDSATSQPWPFPKEGQSNSVFKALLPVEPLCSPHLSPQPLHCLPNITARFGSGTQFLQGLRCIILTWAEGPITPLSAGAGCNKAFTTDEDLPSQNWTHAPFPCFLQEASVPESCYIQCWHWELAPGQKRQDSKAPPCKSAVRRCLLRW